VSVFERGDEGLTASSAHRRDRSGLSPWGELAPRTPSPKRCDRPGPAAWSAGSASRTSPTSGPTCPTCVLNRRIGPGNVFDLAVPLDQVAEGCVAMDERRAINDRLSLPGVLLNDHTDDETQIIRAYRDMDRGMVDRGTDLLDELLDDGYTLTHMTGYRQSRAERLEQVNTGEMRYHDFQDTT